MTLVMSRSGCVRGAYEEIFLCWQCRLREAQSLAGNDEFSPQTLPLLCEFSRESCNTHGDGYTAQEHIKPNSPHHSELCVQIQRLMKMQPPSSCPVHFLRQSLAPAEIILFSVETYLRDPSRSFRNLSV